MFLTMTTRRAQSALQICFIAGTVAALLPAGPRAQAPAKPQAPALPAAAIPKTEAAALAQGWVLLAEGKFDEASQTARRTLGLFPRNVSALALAIEADIARGGATTALTAYEAWLGARTTEEAGVLRRIARAYLYEWSRQSGDTTVRREALLALAADGDDAAGALVAGGAAGQTGRAKLGDDKAVAAIVARMQAEPGLKLREIQALGDTGNPRAGAALVPLLSDSRPENRAAAAEALGTLRYEGAAPQLKRLLEDPRGQVRVSAAGALFRLGDSSGLPVLQELAASEQASVRRSAAILLADQPDEMWKALVRGLIADPDPSIRLDAARLLLPHDPQLATRALDQLRADGNVAIQEEAGVVLAQSPVTGLSDQRRLLRTGTARVKVRAADQILTSTR